MNRKIAYLRSTSIFNDSRASKEIDSYLENNCNVTVIGWNRQNLDLSDFSRKSSKLKMYMFEKSSKYGSGIKNLFKLIQFNLFTYKKLKSTRNNYDIIHACDLDTAIAAYFICKKYNKKLIYDIYDYYVDCHNLGFMGNIVEKIDIKIINSADSVIVCTEQRKKQISKADPKKTVVIHNTPDITEQYKEKVFNHNLIKVCYVGILQDDRLLKEIALEIVKYDNIELHIGGFGKYEDFFKDLSLSNNNIKFYGQMKYSEVLKLESECDVLFATYCPLVANHKYSAPNKVYEAMALGKPIVVCNGTGVDELVIEEKIGISIKYDAKQFVETLNRLSNDDVQKICKRSKELYNNKYSWDRMSKEIITLIESLVVK